MRKICVGGMSRPPKCTKKVPPPAVPYEFRDPKLTLEGTLCSYSEEHALIPTVHVLNAEDQMDYGNITPSSNNSEYMDNTTYMQHNMSCLSSSSSSSNTSSVHKRLTHYQHQLSLQEDQGIDVNQSPGRDSPISSIGSAGSGSRHSSASLDSGRASYHPLSTMGRSTIDSANSPRCSLSSCSSGSDHGKIEKMVIQGLSDEEVIYAFLFEFQFEEYFPLFVSAGYDLCTMRRMTPEDLTAVGIKKPSHRKKLKCEMAQLNIPDNLPDFIPGSLKEWLQLLRLDEYLPAFFEQGYHTVDDVTQLIWEDLEEFGIVKLGHLKKIMLAIKKIKDLKSGKRPIFHAKFGRGSQLGFVRRKSLESLQTPSDSSIQDFCTLDTTDSIHNSSALGWKIRSFDDGDITPTNECNTLCDSSGATLPRPQGIIRPRQIMARHCDHRMPYVARRVDSHFAPHLFAAKPQEQCGCMNPSNIPSNYIPVRSSSLSSSAPKYETTLKLPMTTTVIQAEVYQQASNPLPLPAYPSSDSLTISFDSQDKLPLASSFSSNHSYDSNETCKASTDSWTETKSDISYCASTEHSGSSDVKLKSCSSTESDSIPFANENSGTIRARPGGANNEKSNYPYYHHTVGMSSDDSTLDGSQVSFDKIDVLNDIGNMLANLSEELDAILDEEKLRRDED